MKQILLFFVLIVLTISCTRKITVSKVNTGSDLAESMFYALPRNTLDVEIKVKKSTLKRDVAHSWSDACIKYLADKYDISEDDLKNLKGQVKYESHSMYKDSITMSQGTMPDVEKIYELNVRPTFFTDNVIGLTFTQDYILSEATVSSENKGFEIGLSAGSSILGAITSLSKGQWDETDKAKPSGCPSFTELDAAISAYASYITDHNLPNSTEAYQNGKAYYAKRVEKEFEKALYSKEEKIYSVKFSLNPDNKMADGNIDFFKLNTTNGIIEINQAFQNQIRTSTSDKVNFIAAGDDTWYVLNLKRVTDDVYSKVAQLNVASSKETGLVYNIPGTATFTLRKPKGGNNLLSNTYKMAQFGTTGSLSPKFTKASVTLDPVTGSLIKAGGESKSIATSNITGTGDLVGKAKEAFKKTTEEEELEKRIKLLELRAKLKSLETQE